MQSTYPLRVSMYASLYVHSTSGDLRIKTRNFSNRYCFLALSEDGAVRCDRSYCARLPKYQRNEQDSVSKRITLRGFGFNESTHTMGFVPSQQGARFTGYRWVHSMLLMPVPGCIQQSNLDMRSACWRIHKSPCSSVPLIRNHSNKTRDRYDVVPRGYRLVDGIVGGGACTKETNKHGIA